jgi:hypothetical protein
MKRKNMSFVASAVLAASVMSMIASSTARAEDLPQTKAHQQFSVRQGFTTSELSTLQRSGAVDPSKVGSALIAKLQPGSAYRSAKDGAKLQIAGQQWTLAVSADGSAADYQDQAVAARAHSLAKPVSEKIAAADLEQKGRAFIASKLASQIALGANEELVALRADYRTDGGHDLATGEISQSVVANRIVFGRTIRGVPIVGNGSKVIITFTNDGSLESFRYDWPTYQSGSAQQAVDAGQILSRVQKVVSVRDGVAAPGSGVPAPHSQGDAYPVALTANTQLQTLDCGYYDAGSFAGHAQSVQPGCTYLAVSQDTNGIRAGYAGAVPAGAEFTSDASWLETQILGRK